MKFWAKALIILVIGMPLCYSSKTYAEGTSIEEPSEPEYKFVLDWTLPIYEQGMSPVYFVTNTISVDRRSDVFYSVPVTIASGNTYFIGHANKEMDTRSIFVVDRNGKLKWRYTPPGKLSTTIHPFVDPEGNVYLLVPPARGNERNYLAISLSNTGKIRWTTTIEALAAYDFMLTSSNKELIFASLNKNLSLSAATGKIQTLPKELAVPKYFAAESKGYYVFLDNRNEQTVYEVYNTQRKLLYKVTADKIDPNPIKAKTSLRIMDDGSLLVFSHYYGDTTLKRYDQKGKLLWHNTYPKQVLATPKLMTQGEQIYLQYEDKASRTSFIVALNPTNGKEKSKLTFDYLDQMHIGSFEAANMPASRLETRGSNNMTAPTDLNLYVRGKETGDVQYDMLKLDADLKEIDHYALRENSYLDNSLESTITQAFPGTGSSYFYVLSSNNDSFFIYVHGRKTANRYLIKAHRDLVKISK
ncbi:hypothetical protein [Paenibacillus sp. Marseille-Q9583]